MPSPFPGMDPWLESPALFPDLHDSLIFLLREAVNAALPRPYYARTRTRVWIEDHQRREPDVSVASPPSFAPSRGDASARRLFAEVGMLTVEMDSQDDPMEETYLEIYSADGERLVTAVEVLSLSNKSSGDKGREAYCEKQAEYLNAGTGLVEIDLLRDGRHTTAVPLSGLRRSSRDHAYHVCVTGAAVGRQYSIAPIRLADSLPRIPIPLDLGVTPVLVELQPLLDRSYDSGNYDRSLQYARPPIPALSAPQQAWADAILREKGLIPPVPPVIPQP